MDIRQLKYFIAIAEERQITAAARRLHMAQPPLSQQLKSLEHELGVELVERHGKSLELTEAGVMLYQHALTIVGMLEQSQMEVKEVGQGISGKLTIGINTLSDPDLPKLLLTFRQRYPKITYKIQQNDSAQLCKLVRERELELAIVRLPPPLPLSDFFVIPFRHERFYYVISNQQKFEGHKEKRGTRGQDAVTRGQDGPIAEIRESEANAGTREQNVVTRENEPDAVTWEQVARYPMIIPSTEGLGLYERIVEQFTQRHVKPNILCECSDITVLLNLVSAGFGATIVPENVLNLHQGYASQLRVYPIAESRLTAASGLIGLKRHHLSKAARHFIELLAETQKTEPPSQPRSLND